MYKWFFLFVLAYFVYRTLRNLIDASLGRAPNRQQFQRHRQRVNVRDHSPRQEQSAEASHQDESRADVEDAKWTDL